MDPSSKQPGHPRSTPRPPDAGPPPAALGRPNATTSVRFGPLVAAVVVAVGLVGVCVSAPAQELHPPRVGQQYFSVGGSFQPGFLYDPTVPPERRWSNVTATGGGMVRAGFHHILADQLIMSAEADVGPQWFNDHTAERTGQADSEWAIGWQVNLTARWLPWGVESGWMVGAGPNLYQVHLAEQPLQSLGLNVALGQYLWTDEERFLLVEAGYGIPFIQGLKRSGTVEQGAPDGVSKDWTFHRFNVNIQYGF